MTRGEVSGSRIGENATSHAYLADQRSNPLTHSGYEFCGQDLNGTMVGQFCSVHVPQIKHYEKIIFWGYMKDVIYAHMNQTCGKSGCG
jgi:hypothetical protein